MEINIVEEVQPEISSCFDPKTFTGLVNNLERNKNLFRKNNVFFDKLHYPPFRS